MSERQSLDLDFLLLSFPDMFGEGSYERQKRRSFHFTFSVRSFHIVHICRAYEITIIHQASLIFSNALAYG